MVNMTVESFMIESRECTAHVCAGAELLLVQPVDENDAAGLEKEAEAIAERASVPVVLVTFSVEDWNSELSPWEAPPVFGRTGFGRGAEATLLFIEKKLLPAVRTRYGLSEDVPAILGGYSLAAFFALWVSCQTDVFCAVAAASPSVWFPNWMEYAREHGIKSRCAYLSLGDREEKVKNNVMATVGDCIREQHRLNISVLGEKNCKLEWNEGNHFREPALRCAKAFAWCMRASGKANG